ncbi:putative pre-16S rRNA nuclease [Sinomonas cellulolyticus]|jgi:putative Holliday junction resolvase|uniref:Putative pre-16S rRNA nuclease n=1 Tax=Sinomonas cellulolyticus TaxID=2801916 RepID=A0ABS1K2N8_9MICC|nr:MULTISPECIES: Holliday junction resolvase RuvX [Sinomonas]MBL0705177.1 Holliday junction resolvase RuvX [Sinomonas cellulolyticus]GHG39709.1 putative pre-16S rRNA nuclease [Sinomonas sp. KCTC 49339]
MTSHDLSGRPFPRGVRLAVDVGSVRVGVAVCDADGILPTPVKTLARDPKRNSDIKVLVREAAERGAVEIYVGLPRTLAGREAESAAMARSFAELLAAQLAAASLACPVRLVDERFTTVEAHRHLRAAGMDSREHRRVVDQMAAVGILTHALDLIRGRGEAGALVEAPNLRSGEIRSDDSDVRG